MKRVLHVDSDVHYKVLYVGFIVGGDKLASTGKDNAYILAGIKKKLDSIGVPDEDNFMKLNGSEKPVRLELSQREYEKLGECLEKFEYRTFMVDRVADMFDWYSAAEKE